jgi:hypothetical protein
MTVGPGTPGAVMEAFAEGFACGQAGVLTVTIDDGNGANVLGPTTADIIELECSPDSYGVYRYLGVFPADPSLSPYLITWEGPSGTDPSIDTTASEEILVSTSVPAVPSEGGPCTDWITGDDVMVCCGVESSSGLIFDDVAVQAQNLLYELSGRLFGGLCGPVTVRPCTDGCSCFPAQRLAYASGGSRLIWTGDYWGWGGNGSRNCGCGCLSRVLLSGYPVQEITEVKIDGDIVAPSEYRLDENRFLTRMNGTFWPSCQDLSVDDTEDGSFSVSYVYGATPPALAVSAAAQLACELYKACLAGSGAADCQLPSGITRIVRQGITIEKQAFANWAWSRGGGWHSGLSLVDAFLASYNPAGIMRRPTFWAPGQRYARRVG